jgi:hypothetical protein
MIVFDKTKNPQKSPYQPMDLKNLQKKIREPKVSRLLPNLCDLYTKSIGYGMDLKMYRKSKG